MKKTRHSPERIFGKLRGAEVVLAKGGTVGMVCKRIGVTEQTHYRLAPT
ncbi:MAG: IS3 family transposase, partial [SAR324 cluster bacterium]|nr:IS3 family transposase [SAR324 cluster bacterium]